MTLQEFVDTQRISNKLSQRGRQLATQYWPTVYFKIPGIGLKLYFYRRFLSNLLSSFILTCDPRNEYESKMMKMRGCGRVNEESGIGCIYIDGHFISHCKMYVCDGQKESRVHNPEMNYKPWRGLIFRDHADPNPYYNTGKVWLIADKFEEFLKENNVRYSRINVEKKQP